MIDFHLGEKGRAKITVAYHYSLDATAGAIELEEINYRKMECRVLNSTAEYFNRFLNDDASKVLRDVFHFEPIEPEASPEEYVDRKFGELKGTADKKFLQNLICNEELQYYIRSVTLKVAPSEFLRRILEARQIDLYIRDTTELFGLITNTGTSILYGGPDWSDPDGVIFCCSDEYPDFIQKLGRDSFAKLIHSLPTILIARDRKLFKHFTSNGMPITWTNVSEWITKLQKGLDHDIYYPDIEEYFTDTYGLFTGSANSEYADGSNDFQATFGEAAEARFLLPFHTGLKSLGNMKSEQIPDSLVKNEEFNFLRMVANAITCNYLNRICDLRSGFDKLFAVPTYGEGQSIAEQYFCKAYHDKKPALTADYENFDINPHSDNASFYAKPQKEDVSRADLERFLNSTRPVLGSREGITTDDPKETLIVAASAYRWIGAIIDQIAVDSDICDANGNMVFGLLKGNFDRQEKLLKHALREILKKIFSDRNAQHQDYPLVERDSVKKGIEKHREKPEANCYAFVDAIDHIISEFISEIRSGGYIPRVEYPKSEER